MSERDNSEILKDIVETVVQKYLKEALSVYVYHSFVYNNELRVQVILTLGGKQIATDHTDISLDNL